MELRRKNDVTGIPIHYLQDAAEAQLSLARFEVGQKYDGIDDPFHRDDHYIFFLIEKGYATLSIDFQEIILKEGCVYYVLPGQVHRPVSNEAAQGWYLAADPTLIPEAFRTILEYNTGLQSPLYPHANIIQQCSDILRLVAMRCVTDTPSVLESGATTSLFQSFAGIVADGYNISLESSLPTSRPKQLSHAFKKLVAAHFRLQKGPSWYAASLNISENYLNEALKKITGFSASYWINRQILLEAKRLLVYTTTDVKEVAGALGYDDPAYFARLFKKGAGLSPSAYRAQNVE